MKKKHIKYFVFLLALVVLLVILMQWLQEWREKRLEADLAQAMKHAATCRQDPVSAGEACRRGIVDLNSLIARFDQPDTDRRKQKAQQVLLEVYLAKGQLDDAIPLLNELAKLNPQESESYQQLAKVYAQKGNERAAIRYSHLSVQLAPDSWKALIRYAEVLEKFGYTEEALGFYEKSLNFAPTQAKVDVIRKMDQIIAKTDTGFAEFGHPDDHEPGFE